MSALLEVRQLRASYGAGEVLSDVNLEIGPGEFAALLGRNGMGKTTTVRAILGLTPPQGGEIRFGGERIDGWKPDRIARAGIGLVPEGRQIFPNLTVRENLTAFAARDIFNASTVMQNGSSAWAEFTRPSAINSWRVSLSCVAMFLSA